MDLHARVATRLGSRLPRGSSRTNAADSRSRRSPRPESKTYYCVLALGTAEARISAAGPRRKQTPLRRLWPVGRWWIGGGPSPASGNTAKGRTRRVLEAGTAVSSRGVSLDQRKRDMHFSATSSSMRRAVGLTVGQNLKRGGPEVSTLLRSSRSAAGSAWISPSYDDPRATLNMMWYQHGASTSWVFPYHKPSDPQSNSWEGVRCRGKG